MTDLRFWLLLGICSCASLAHAAKGGQLTLLATDRDSGAPVACRMHLKNARNQPNKPPKLPFFHDHFVFDGEITLTLPKGEYTFEVERGPEYLNRTGHFLIEDFAEDTHIVDLKRVVDMSKEGWWSGDLYVDRPELELPLLMEADDLHLAQRIGKLPTKPAAATAARKPSRPPKPAKGTPVAISTQNGWTQYAGQRWLSTPGQSDSRAGNLFLFCDLGEPLKFAEPPAEAAPIWDLVSQARQQPSAWIDAGRAFSWDLPLLAAEGQVDSIELANSQLCRSSVLPDEAGGKPRDRARYAGDSGVGRWTETIYYHLLNCGLRIPPSAGSGSGLSPNPVGYDRVYVHIEDEFTVEKWWEGLKAGRVFVTNGPLIRPRVEGELPGHMFQFDAGQEHEFEIGLTLSTREKVEYLEIVQNGEVAHRVRLEEWVDKKGRLPLLKFAASGWFLMRAVTSTIGTYRFASTGPYYVSVGYQPRVSKASAQFFLDWIDARAKMLKFASGEEQAKANQRYNAARTYWQSLVAKANAP